jgi:hypothetical protein
MMETDLVKLKELSLTPRETEVLAWVAQAVAERAFHAVMVRSNRPSGAPPSVIQWSRTDQDR